ncbi:MAG: tetratricopeptide repeat protein [Acidobacteria bacterium]|nr:tetratricopeptide repeat protein [Acidobacteriota bacterium]
MQGSYDEAIRIAYQACELARQHLAPDDLEFGALLNNLAGLYVKTGDYTKAKPLFEEALEICRSSIGEQNTEFAAALNNLAIVCKKLGDYESAERLFKQAFEIVSGVVGEYHPIYAKCLLNLAGLYHELGDKAAIEMCEQAVEAQRKSSGKADPDFALSLNNLAVLYKDFGKYQEAEALFKRVLEMQGRMLGKEHPDFAKSLDDLGLLYEKLGDYRASEAFCGQAFEIRRVIFGERHPDFVESLKSLASIQYRKGDYATAAKLYMQAMRIWGEIAGQTNLGYALFLNNLALQYQELGNFATAEELYKQAIEITRNAVGERHPSYATCLNNIGLLYYLMCDDPKALQFQREAANVYLAVYGERHPAYAKSLNNLALALAGIGGDKNYKEAESLYQQVLEITRLTLGERHPDYAIGLSNLADLYYYNQDFSSAEEQLQKALDVCRAAVGERHPSFASILSSLSAVRYSTGDYEMAERLCRSAAETYSDSVGEQHNYYANCLKGLGMVCAATDRHEEALRLMQNVADIEDHYIGQIFSIGSETQRIAYLQFVRGSFDGLLSLVSQHLSHSKDAVLSAFDLALKRKAVGLEALAIQRDAVLSGAYPDLEPKLRELTTLRTQIAEKTLEGPGLEDFSTHRQRLAEWNTEKEILEKELARRIPEMNLEQALRNADRQVVAMALPEGTWLVEFVKFHLFDFKAVPARKEQLLKSARYCAFVLAAGEQNNVQMIDLGEAEPIDRMIATFRSSITGEAEEFKSRGLGGLPDENSSKDIGKALRVALFDRLLSALGDRKKLIIAPDGELTRLPFEALPNNYDRYLIDDYQISYVSAGRDTLRFGRASGTQRNAATVLAAPDFDLADESGGSRPEEFIRPRPLSRDLEGSELHFEQLSGMRAEGESIAGRLEVTPMLGESALDSHIKACISPRILHMATHGFFLKDQELDLDKITVPTASGMDRLSRAGVENPLLRSGLALAGANTWLGRGVLPRAAEDGFLFADDVMGMNLLGTELVVLSACETGLGEVRIGEGVLGFRRSFVVAGAKTLVMSLWKVPDGETRELMEVFYARILAGYPRAEALREAQLDLKANHKHAFYWGAFICQGDPYPL